MKPASSGRRRPPPFKVGLVNVKVGDGATDKACADLYVRLSAKGVDVLYDDRDERPGAKFAGLDLIGRPYQLIVGPKGLADGKVELKLRRSGARELMSVDDAVVRLTS